MTVLIFLPNPNISPPLFCISPAAFSFVSFFFYVFLLPLFIIFFSLLSFFLSFFQISSVPKSASYIVNCVFQFSIHSSVIAHCLRRPHLEPNFNLYSAGTDQRSWFTDLHGRQRFHILITDPCQFCRQFGLKSLDTEPMPALVFTTNH